jgi:hypothetical protein
MGTSDFDLRVKVTAGSETVYDTHLVTYDDGTNPWKRNVGDNPTTTEIPETYHLSQNYPNPFNPSTTIKYQIPEAAHVTIRIYNLLGKEVTRLVNQTHVAGYYDVQWDGKDDSGHEVASGIYIYRIEAGEFSSAVRKLAILR